MGVAGFVVVRISDSEVSAVPPAPVRRLGRTFGRGIGREAPVPVRRGGRGGASSRGRDSLLLPVAGEPPGAVE